MVCVWCVYGVCMEVGGGGDGGSRVHTELVRIHPYWRTDAIQMLRPETTLCTALPSLRDGAPPLCHPLCSATPLSTSDCCMRYFRFRPPQINRYIQQLQGATLEELERASFGAVQDLSPKFDEECKASGIT